MVKITPRPLRPLPERPVLIQNGDLCLEGMYIKKKTEEMPVLLSCPHPQFGGSMDSPVINELAYAFAQEEMASLRYNYRGVGASQGSWDEGRGELTDLAAACEFLVETFYGTPGAPPNHDIALAGFSFGSWLSVQHALHDSRVQRLLLVGPPLGKKGYDYSIMTDLRIPMGIVLGEKDQFCSVQELNDFLAAQTKKNSNWRLPEVYIVPEASHYFVRGLSNAGQAAARFLKTTHFGIPQ